MSILHSHQTEALINRLVSDDSSVLRISDSQFSDFIRSYYYGVAYEELDQRDVFDLRGAALAHFELCKTPSVGRNKNQTLFSRCRTRWVALKICRSGNRNFGPSISCGLRFDGVEPSRV